MNAQGKLVSGKVVGGIEWTKTVLPDGSERRGYTWNPIGGCMHACQWVMPDGNIANCYAEDVAERVAQSAYPYGFEHHYWKPDILAEPLRVRQPSKIFVGSMADVFGHWVPDWQIAIVLSIARMASWHTFQFLTKNPKRVRQFNLPPNVWIGASSPPDYMWNKPLRIVQKRRLMDTTLDNLNFLKASVRWMSFEPLSEDWIDELLYRDGTLDWAVIGAASSGNTYYPPNEHHVRELVEVLDDQRVPVFFKGNMRSLPWAVQNWREDFPVSEMEVNP